MLALENNNNSTTIATKETSVVVVQEVITATSGFNNGVLFEDIAVEAPISKAVALRAAISVPAAVVSIEVGY